MLHGPTFLRRLNPASSRVIDLPLLSNASSPVQMSEYTTGIAGFNGIDTAPDLLGGGFIGHLAQRPICFRRPFVAVGFNVQLAAADSHHRFVAAQLPGDLAVRGRTKQLVFSRRPLPMFDRRHCSAEQQRNLFVWTLAQQLVVHGSPRSVLAVR